MESETRGLFDFLQSKVGEGKPDHGTFEHCGVKHDQSADRTSIKVTMDHDIEQLKPVVAHELSGGDLEAAASPACKALFLSLLGGSA